MRLCTVVLSFAVTRNIQNDCETERGSSPAKWRLLAGSCQCDVRLLVWDGREYNRGLISLKYGSQQRLPAASDLSHYQPLSRLKRNITQPRETEPFE